MTRSRQQNNYKALVFTPAEISTAYAEYAGHIKTHAEHGLTWGVPSMDKAIIPLRPGDVMGIIARPGHGKSSTAAFFAKRVAAQIAADSRQENSCVIYATYEQTVEECEAFFQAGQAYTATDFAWGRVPMDTINRRALERISLPVWLMGKSLVRRKQTPRMTPDVLYKAIYSIEEDYSIKPALVVIDYIQIVPVERARDRIQQVGEAIVKSKELAADIGAPILMCVQARRDVDQYKSKIPAAGDCQWASQIEQAADKLLGIWRPFLTEDVEFIKVNGIEVQVSQNLFIAKLLKQRWSAAGQTFFLRFDPAAVKLADLELRNQPPPVEF
jgi:replicative DNA helicase